MCFTYDARPPHPPIAGGAADSEELVLTSADGTKFAAFAARAETPTGAGMVVLPDVRGLYPFYEELALRFAEQGINSVAIDYFGRTAGVSRRGEDFDWLPQVQQTKQDLVAQDTGAAVAYLRSPAGGSCTSVFTVGFCFGGSSSWNQAAAGHDLAGAIGFYGRPGDGRFDGSPGPISRVGAMTCPILGLMGGADPGIPPNEVQAYREALTSAGVEHEVIEYPGAPHSFFDRSYDEHRDACADAWRRVLAFVAANARA